MQINPYTPYNTQPTTVINPYQMTPVPTYTPQQQVNQQQQTVNSERIWVQGEAAGKSYLVSKNCEQVLWDTEKPSIYIKTVDAFGRPSMVTLDYTIRQPKPEPTTDNQAINSEFDALKAEMSDLKSMMAQLMEQNKRTGYKPKYNKEVSGND